MITPRQIALVHAVARQLGWSEDEYRGVLESVGVKHANQLDGWKLNDFLRHAKKCGYQHPDRQVPLPGRDAIMGKISAQLRALGRDWKYADAMARKMFKVDKVQWLDPERKYKLVQALAEYQERLKRRAG